MNPLKCDYDYKSRSEIILRMALPFGVKWSK